MSKATGSQTDTPQIVNEPPVTRTPKNPMANNMLFVASIAVVALIVVSLSIFMAAYHFKKRIKSKTISIVAVCLIIFSCFSFTLQQVNADQTATENYVPSTPIGTCDYAILNYTDASIGVVRMSDWANLMTFVGYNSDGSLITPPWAGIKNDYNQVWTNVLSTISYGSVYSKEVAFPISQIVNIPDKVYVDVSYRGSEYSFTSPANSVGAPYMIKIGTKMLNGYYIACDDENRVCFASTNCSQVANSAYVSGDNIIWGEGTFILTAPIVMDMGDSTVGQGYNVTTIKAANGISIDSILKTTGTVAGTAATGFIKITGVTIDGNREGGATVAIGINFQAYYSQITSCRIISVSGIGVRNAGVDATHSGVNNVFSHNYVAKCGIGYKSEKHGSDVTFEGNIIEACDTDGVYWGSGNLKMTNNNIYSNGRFGVNILGGIWGSIIGNWIGGNNLAEIYFNAGSTFRAGEMLVSGNSFVSRNRDALNSTGSLTLDGYSVAHPVINVRIEGNDFFDDGGQSSYAIKLTDYAVNCTIIGNTQYGIFGTGFLFVGTGCAELTVRDNPGWSILSQATVTYTGFNDLPPTELSNAIDRDLSTPTSTGTQTTNVAITFGRLNIALPFDPANLTTPVNIGAKISGWASTGTVSGYWWSSPNNVNWIQNSGVIAFAYTGTTEQTKNLQTEGITTQYFSLGFYVSGAAEANAKVYEIYILNG
ncbi:MAG: right-handed parallel beta-helix repeat-containing protein [Nitrososphaerota archaeon]|nr:right-handed parallel beta-helix repeat-containing protein [Nitrososphaerota archaeon]